MEFKLSEKEREGIGQRIRDVILDHGYETIQDFIDDYGIKRGTFDHWIKDGVVNIAFLIKFSGDFNLDLRWLLIGPPYPKHEKPRHR